MLIELSEKARALILEFECISRVRRLRFYRGDERIVGCSSWSVAFGSREPDGVGCALGVFIWRMRDV
jgi:hypothetical protein